MSRRSRAVASHFHRFKTFLDFFSVQFGINMKVLLSPEIAPNRYILKTLIQHHHLYQISTKLTSSPSVLAVSAQRNFFTSFFCNVLSFSVPIVVDTFSDFSYFTPSSQSQSSARRMSALVIVLEVRVLNMRVSSNAPFRTITCISRGATFNMTVCGYAVVSPDITSDNQSHFDVTVT